MYVKGSPPEVFPETVTKPSAPELCYLWWQRVDTVTTPVIEWAAVRVKLNWVYAAPQFLEPPLYSIFKFLSLEHVCAENLIKIALIIINIENCIFESFSMLKNAHKTEK